ncbi:MAG: RHS repeat-associated core domain-containing protein [Planctomycetota bacterium]
MNQIISNIQKISNLQPEIFITTNVYDNLDRMTSSTDNLSNVTEYKYDSRNNNKWNRDREDHITRRNYDGLDRLRENIYELTPTGTITVKYELDKNGRLITLTDDKNNVTQYEYDGVNRRNREILPDSSQKNYIFGQYGELSTITDPNGNIVNNTYDNGLRLTQKNITRGSGVEGTTQEVFGYDGLSRMDSASNYENSNLISQITMAYDSMNNFLQETQQISGQSAKSVQSAYDTMGFRTSLTYPNSRQITFVPNVLNRIDLIKEGSNNIADYDYVGPSRVKERTYLNGTKLTATYDGSRRATSYQHLITNNQQLIAGFEYTFDKEDNKLYEKRLLENKGEAFRYDAIYRLTGVKYGVPNLDPLTTYDNYLTFDSKEEFALDGVGNRQTVITDSTVITYTTNNLNQYTEISGTNYVYDLNGNLISDSVKTYVYDYTNQLLEVISGTTIIADYKYDAFGRRIQKTDNLSLITYNYYYDGARCIEERNSSDVVIKSYVYGNGIDEVLTMQTVTQAYYYHTNSLGSVYAVTDGTGNVVERYKYKIYGRCTFFEPDGVTERTESIIGNRLLFTGREYDVESGLYYYRARYYSPDLGRFINRDPIADDELANLYTYVKNNPLKYKDPRGQRPNYEEALKKVLADAEKERPSEPGEQWELHSFTATNDWTLLGIIEGDWEAGTYCRVKKITSVYAVIEGYTFILKRVKVIGGGETQIKKESKDSIPRIETLTEWEVEECHKPSPPGMPPGLPPSWYWPPPIPPIMICELPFPPSKPTILYAGLTLKSYTYTTTLLSDTHNLIFVRILKKKK